MAHLQHRGMGGGPGRNTRGNVLGLCQPHHYRYDNGDFTETDWHDLLSVVTYRGEEGCDWPECEAFHEEALHVVVWARNRQTYRMFCRLHATVITGKVVSHRRAEVRILMRYRVAMLRYIEEPD